MCKTPRKRIVFLAFEGVNLIDIGGPMQAFALSEDDVSGSFGGYDLVVASSQGGVIRTSPGLMVLSEKLSDLDPGSIDTVVVPGGSRVGMPPQDREMSRWLAEHGPAIPRICGVCTGAFILADSGLLAGRRVATHWRWVDVLQKRHPEIHVEADPIYLEDGKFWTSAGVTAGIDLALRLIANDRTTTHAANVARTMVVYMTRPGGQTQFSVPLELQGRQDHMFSRVDDWILANISKVIRLPDLAVVAGMSERSFRRNYAASVGRTPMKTVEILRLEAASQMLLSNTRPLKEIARACGAGSQENLERLFKRGYKMTPSVYRERFSDPV